MDMCSLFGLLISLASVQSRNLFSTVMISVGVLIALWLLYYCLLWSDRPLFIAVRQRDQHQVARAREYHLTFQAGASLPRSRFDENAENINQDVLVKNYRPMGKPNLTCKF